MKKTVYNKYVTILKEELVTAMGCTEPISLAYAAAVAKQELKSRPISVSVAVSGNIIKNVKSVIVPNTNGMRGIEAAVAAGVVAGKAERKLEVLSQVSDKEKKCICKFLKECPIELNAAKSEKMFFIDVKIFGENGETARVVIEDYHSNITLIEHNGEAVFVTDNANERVEAELTDRSCLNVKSIIEFADSVNIDDVSEVINRQIELNSAISKEGLTNDWGARIGKIILHGNPDDIVTRAKAVTAAGSDARMSGCELPVVIVSGSGNQGMTASLPVIEYAKYLESSQDTLVRALVVANLVTIHEKTGIGRLSAFCGAVSAGCGAASGVAYLYGGRYDAIAHTIVNALAITSGMVCDGAKPSCAGKIAIAVEAGILGYKMYGSGCEFKDGEGIVTKGVDNTIANVGRLASLGMRETDKEILDIMTKKKSH